MGFNSAFKGLTFCYANQNGNYRVPKKAHNAEAWAGSHASPCGIYCGHNGTRSGLYPKISIFLSILSY